mmetsp:Transcript_79861/g.237917  ORF Transcript_79861/g.237917 Transcript_79861/m.237917 type:complete len:299 (-) Transcript_79861:225-1121(-)
MTLVLSFFSSARSSVASFRAFMLLAIALLSAAISSCNLAFDASFSVICAVRLSISCAFASLMETAFTISLSQKPFVVASAWACASSRLTRSLMMERTFTKWSSETCTCSAATESTGLCRRSAAARSMARAFRCCRAPRSLPRSCRKAGAACWFFCRPTSRRFAFQLGATPVSRASKALLMAVISSARVCDRVSHSFALSSQLTVRIFMKAWSAPLAASSAVFSACASCSFSVLKASSFSFSSFSFSAAFFSLLRPSFLLSKAAFASNSSRSRRFLVSVNVTSNFSRVAMMSFAWYEYS